MKTIAVVSTGDTKKAELELARDFIRANDFNVITIDISTRAETFPQADIKPFEILDAGGYSKETFLDQKTKAKKLSMMQQSLEIVISKLYHEEKIHGILGLGGLQNSMLNAAAMQQLPVGFPKVILSTVACGNRTFGSLVGTKDITLMPSIADIVGVNPITEVVIKNAAAAVMGMVKYAGALPKTDGQLIGATMMGATGDGIVEAIEHVRQAEFTVITFHSTGVGGLAMENLIDSQVINAVLDLSLHEIVSEDVIGGGFSVGAKDRLSAAVRQQIPMVLAPAGLDFIDFPLQAFQDGVVGDPAKRKYTLHNKDIAHIKLFPEEAKQAAEIVVERLRKVKGNAVMILPLQGLRSESQPGGRMHDPEVDNAIFEVLRHKLNKNVRIIELDAHLSDPLFSETAANALIELLS
ncbi:Tm-1-like ATP-binding domain-containing protein [bacterium]|nr:Tm-1-like ATP-binding domain-containing protein [bacterium]